MGKSKRSRSRERSSERTSKRLRNLEDRMEELTTGIAMIKEAILGRQDPDSETYISEHEGTDGQVDQSGGKDPEATVDDMPPVDPIFDMSSENPNAISNGPAKADTEPLKDKDTETPWNLDADALRILGEEPVQEEPELILHSSVSNRWKKYLSEGLKKEVKEALLVKYPRKGKLSFEPPILNDEVAGNLKESALKRDKYFGATQKLAGSALAALAPVIESLATLKDPDSVKRLEQVWDAAKLLIEIHKSQTVARRACILPTLSKHWATALEKREPDSFLFGEKLVDKVKEIKAIGKVGEEMKPAPPKKPYIPLGSLNSKSSSSQKRSVSQASGKFSSARKSLTPKYPAKQATYPKSGQYRQQNPRSQNR